MRTLCLSIFFFILATQIHSQCCLRFQGRKCAQCPAGTHLFRGNCLLDIKDCATYKDGFDCGTCNTGFQLNTAGDCQKSPASPPPPQPQSLSNPAYSQTKLDVNSAEASSSDVYILCNDFFKTTKAELGADATPVGALIRAYPNNSAEVTIEYETSRSIYYRAVASLDIETFVMKEISFGRVPTPTFAQPTSNTTNNSIPNNSIQNNTTPDPTPPKPTTSPNTDPPSLTYTTVTQPDSDDLYLISKDFLSNQLPQFSQMEPASTKKSTQPPLTYYLFRFNKLDGSVWDILVKIDGETYIAAVQRKLQVVAPVTKAVVSGFVRVDVGVGFKDVYFIVVLDYINKQSSNKYKDAPIRTLDKLDANGTITYKVAFEQAARLWEVVATINTGTFATSGYSQTQKQAITPAQYTNSISTPQNPKNNTPTSNPTTPTNTTSNTTANATVAPTPPPTSQLLRSLGITPPVTNVITPASNTPVSNTPASNTSQPSGANSISTPKPQSNTTNPTPNNDTSQKNNNPTNPTPQQPKNNNTQQPKTNPTSQQPKTNSSTQQSKLTQQPKTNNPNSNNNNGVSSLQQAKINSVIQELASGLTSLSRSDMSAAEFKQIDSLVRASNPLELKNSVVVGAYVKSSSFTKNYQVYYMQQAASQDIYAAVISRDQLRKRTYIISFGKVGY